MKKSTKTMLITASVLIIAGGIIFVGVMSVFKWNFSNLSTAKYETNSYDIGEAFDSISVNTDIADVEFLRSDDGKRRVECYEEENAKHTVDVKGGTLSIDIDNKKKWYNYVGFNFETPKITVYLDDSDYNALTVKSSTGHVTVPKNFKFESIDIELSTGDVKCMASASGLIKIKATTGSITVSGANAKELDLTATTGKVTLSDIACEGDVKVDTTTGKTELTELKCENLMSTGSTGAAVLKCVTATKKLSVTRSTGKITLDSSDGGELFLKTSTGDVNGSLLTDKVFVTHTSTGSIDVPKTTSGGVCEISTSTGNIKITVKN